MKQLLFIPLISLLFSCKKELSEDMQRPTVTADAKISSTNIQYTSFYNDSVWSCSANEWIYLTGEVSTHIIEQISDNKYHGMFESNFSKVTGTGATSGKTYNGGGILKGEVSITLNSDQHNVNASTKEKLHFLCEGIGFDFDVESKYIVNSQGEVKVDYITDKTKNCNG